MTTTETKPKTTRGTTNKNATGNTRDRAARKRWLLATFASDVQLLRVHNEDGTSWVEIPHGPNAVVHLMALPYVVKVEGLPTCRCYRCGKLLHYETLTTDRIIPGCRGGKYRRDNIRPACGMCNSVVGGALRS
jgi:5-methylcytosine-specific restriction endonuclease McrA